MTFKGTTGMLVLDHATQFTGSIVGMTGDGTAAHSDQIDLKDISYGSGTTVSFSGNTAGGVLTVTDAQNHTAHLSLVGNYTNSTFNLSSDGNGGTLVIDPPKDQFQFAPTPALGSVAAPAPTAHVASDGLVLRSRASPTAFSAGIPVLDMHARPLFSSVGSWPRSATGSTSRSDRSRHAPFFHRFMLH